jgi:acyl carrier protein
MTTFEKLRAIVLEQMRDGTIPIELDSRFKEDLAFTSIQQIRLITAIESAFEISLRAEDFKESNFSSLRTLIKMLEANYAL